MDLLPALASSTANRLRESTVLQSFRRRFSRRTMASPEVCWPLPMRAIGAQNLLTMPGGVSTSGYLHKKGGSQFSLLKWPLRYIIIHKGCVYYFKTSTSPSPQGAFSLNGYNRVMRAAEETTSSNVFPFKIIHFSKKHRTWYLSAASEEERRKWMRHLRREIDRYNDRRESHIPSDSDSDAESFYGSIERPMDIKHSVDNTEHDYMEEEDDEEEDYVKPDSDCSPMSTGRATVPPPAYPPPPVPSVIQPRHSLPPPLPSPNKTPPCPRPKNPPPSFPPPSIHRDPPLKKGPPPPPPNNVHPHKPHPPLTSPAPQHLPPCNPKRPLQSWTSTAPGGGADRRDRRPSLAVALLSPATLPICNQLESRMVLDSPVHSSNVTGMGGRGNSPSSNHHRAISNHSTKSGVPLPPPPNSKGSIHTFTSPPMPGPPDPLTQTQPSSPRLPPPHLLPQLPKPGALARPTAPKPPPPTVKPPTPPTKPGHRGPSNQRESPDGQSFRSSVERPAGSTKRGDSDEHSREDDGDQDYENVHLPESVFVDTTETSSVEKLFKDSCKIPLDGLYCIRNSGTKTSKVLVVWDVSLGKARNYRLFVEETRVFLDNELNFPSLSVLVEYYHRHPLPNNGSLCLQHPYGYAQPR